MRIKTRILIILFVFTLILFVSACGGNSGSDEKTYEKIEVFLDNKTVEYNGQMYNLEIDEKLPEGVSVFYEYYLNGQFCGNEGVIEPGEYEVIARFEGEYERYGLPKEITATLIINGNGEIKPVEVFFYDKTFEYDGDTHSIYISGYLPNDVSVTYEGNNQIEPGEYVVTAWFNGEFKKYNLPSSMQATMTINKKAKEEFNISYYDFNSELIETRKVLESEFASEINAPEINGYNFIGWSTNGDLNSLFDFNTPITNNLNLYAVYEPVLTHEIVFMCDDDIKFVNVLDGKVIENECIPVISETPNKVFLHWEDDEGNCYSNEGLMNLYINKNYTFKAVFEEYFTLTIDRMGSIETINVIINTAINNLDPHTPSGYEFVNWTVDGAHWDPSFIVTSDIYVVANYVEVFRVDYYLADGSEYAFMDVRKNAFAINYQLDDSFTSKFIGWEFNGKLFDFTTPITSNMSLTAVYKDIYVVNVYDDNSRFTLNILDGEVIGTLTPSTSNAKFIEWQVNGEAINPETYVVNGNLDIYAVYEYPYCISFYDGLTSNLIKEISIYKGEFISNEDIPTLPQTDDYQFRNWYLYNNYDNPFDFSQPVYSNLILYAIYDQVYTVTFDLGDAIGSIESQKVVAGQCAKVPDMSNVVKEGYRFIDWSSHSSVHFSYDFNTIVNGNITLYAVFKEEFELNLFVDNILYKSIKLCSGEELGEEIIPSYNDLKFAYWNDSNGGIYYSLSRYVAYGDCNLYANFYVNITFDYQINTRIENVEVLYGDVVEDNPNYEEYVGYRFIGWALEDKPNELFDFETKLYCNVTLIPYLIKEHTISFVDEGYVIASFKVLDGEKIDLNQIPQNPYKYHYIFDKWVNIDDEEFNFDSIVTSDIFIYSSYEYEYFKYVVNYFVDNNLYHSEEIIEGQPIEKTTNVPVKDGYKFKLWVDSNYQEYDFTKLVTNNVELHATFSRINKIYFKYDYSLLLDDYTIKVVDNIIDNEPFNLKELANFTPILDGYAFDGWYLDNRFKLEELDNLENYVISGKDITIYAQFREIFTINFKNYETGEIYDSIEVLYGDKLTKTDIIPTLLNHEFGYWSEDTYSFTEFDFERTIYYQFDLYAYFIPYYTVSFETNGGNAIDSLKVLSGNKIEKPLDPVKEGYIFKAWYYNGEEFDFNKDVISFDQTLYAKYYIEMSFDTLGGEEINSVLIDEGSQFDTTQYVANKDEKYFVFWTLNGSKVSKETYYYENTMFTAYYLDIKHSWLDDYNWHIDDNLKLVLDKYNGSDSNIIIPNGVHILGERVYEGCDFITSISLSDTVFEINSFAFNDCSIKELYIPLTVTKLLPSSLAGINNTLEKLTVPYIYNTENDIYSLASFSNGFVLNSIKELTILSGEYIPYNAVEGSVSKIVLPDTVIEIDSQAFKNATQLEYIYIPLSVNKIGVDVFNSTKLKIYYAGNATQFILIDFNSISKKMFDLYCANEKVESITIPSQMKEIISYKFKLFSISEVIVPKHVNKIEEGAFYGCDNIREMILPFIGSSYSTNSPLSSQFSYIFESEYGGYNEYVERINVTVDGDVKIGDEAFKFDTRIGALTVSNTIKSIGNYAFYSSTLNSVNFLSNKISYIGEYAFSNCSQLKCFEFSEIINEISQYAFDNSGLEEVVFAETGSLKTIGEYAFAYTKLVNVNVPDTVESIGLSAFSTNTIKNITVPFIGDRLENKSYTNFTYILGETQHDYCGREIEEITITKEKKVENYAFYGMYKLKKVNLPNDISSIGDYAFYACQELLSIDLSENLEYIGVSAFEACISIDNIHIPNKIKAIKDATFKNCYDLTNITLPDGLTTIGEEAFSECSSLKELVIPSSVNKIHNDALKLIDLNKISMPLDIDNTFTNIVGKNYHLLAKEVIFTSGLVLEDNALEDFIFIEKLVLPNTITTIGKYALSNLGIKEIVIPASVEIIDEYAFSVCYKLENVYFENNSMLKTIENNAFYYCKSIRYIDLSKLNNLTTINSEAFNSLESLIQIKLPMNLTTLGENVFLFNPKLSEVYNLSSINIEEYILSSESEKKFVYHQSLSASSNLITSGDFTFVNIGENYSLIDYYEKSTSTNITLPALEFEYDINMYAFNEAENLEVITLSDKVKNIKSYAIIGCDNLKSVIFGSGVKTIESRAFESCNKLTTITLNNGLETITESAFCSLPSLYSLVIPQTVTTLGDNTNLYSLFSGCYYVCEVYNLSSVELTNVNKFAYHTSNESSSLIYYNNLLFVKYNDDTYELIKYLYYSDDVYLPGKINGSNYKMGVNAFTDYTIFGHFKNLYFEGTLEDWCNFEFTTNSNPMMRATHFFMYNNGVAYEVTSVTIPESITIIGPSQFASFEYLTSITLHSKVTTIYSGSFNNSRIEEVYIPASVTKITRGAFSSTTRIYCEAESKPEGWANGWCGSNENLVVWGYKK